jgi:diguanylate cyclase (GGDEF)-like protein
MGRDPTFPSPEDATPLAERARSHEDKRLLQAHPESEAAGIQRTRVSEAVGALMGRSGPTRRPFALLMIAANALDAVNTEIGYDAGDTVIAGIGRLLKARLGDAGAIWRYGSNTFAVLLDDCPQAAVKEAAERLTDAVAEAPVRTTAGPLRTTISVGAVWVPADGGAEGEVISSALAALRLAKLRPEPVVVQQAENTARREKSVPTGDLLTALDQDRLRIVLQPIVEAASGRTAFYEVLLRLEKADGTLAQAGEFIEDAERLGLTNLLDRRALELALAALAARRTLVVSLNISSQTVGDKSWIAVLRTAAASDPGLLSRLTVEITETAMIYDIERVRGFIELLHGLGCKVAIDDFGAGYTSFRHLKALKVDMLKIDGMFMADLPRDAQNRALVKSMVDIADAFGLETVAEWVSDEETATVLRAVGVKYLQGYLYGRPVPPTELPPA